MSSADAFVHCRTWFSSQGWKAFPFQIQAWSSYLNRSSGIVNAPTGSGKTYSLLLPAIAEGMERSKTDAESCEGVQLIWITPIRALAKEINQSAEKALFALSSNWEVGVRTGDSTQKIKLAQKKKLPQILITTPESIHVMLSNKGFDKLFKNLRAVVVDEWHELLGSKRAVQCELFLSKFRSLNPEMMTWGISATIGNMEESAEVLMGPNQIDSAVIIKANVQKKLLVEPVLPYEVETLPWAGHLGIRLLDNVVPLIHENKSTLIFTNTRAQAEIWFQQILETDPSLAGIIAMHHSAISKELRAWVEEALYDGRLKAVVCTSSLDLGVDFRPVDCVVQIGSPKGVSRFVQRAGRSGHKPGGVSKIYFVPTHGLELLECAALRKAIDTEANENRIPYLRSFDVLIQYFHKVVEDEGYFKVLSRRVRIRHKFNIGTIVSSTMIKVKLQKGKYLGQVEEYFISKLTPGDAFWFAGRSLELVRLKGIEATVKLSKQKKGQVPSYMGGRMPLSAELGYFLREKIEESALYDTFEDPELAAVQPIISLQKERSIVPTQQQFLLEYLEDREGHHLFVYPFEGRLVHEGLASLISFRLGHFKKQTFSIAMNDYGFELYSDQPIPIKEALDSDVFSTENLSEDLVSSLNESEMMQRRFRDIAQISGLVFGF